MGPRNDNLVIYIFKLLEQILAWFFSKSISFFLNTSQASSKFVMSEHSFPLPTITH